ncbi:MAG: YkgJ family cysteine cluster protein [Chlamydiota bacterium]|nr:YkgJ family cysteine cluster protein [Chlamydiota bacterium]
MQEALKYQNQDQKTCVDCFAPCCRYIAIEVQTPRDPSDIDLFKWYLLHRGVSMQIDPDGSWHVIVPTKCEALSEDNMCGVHASRPKVCRDYTLDECERYGPEDHTPIIFRSVEEMETYLKEKKLYGSE